MVAFLSEGEAPGSDQCSGRDGSDGKILQGVMAKRQSLGACKWLVRMGSRSCRPEAKAALLHHERRWRTAIFAALAEVHQGLEPDERDGFVVITAAADQGLVDIHDRKPLVLSPETAREWLDPATSGERLEAIVDVGCRPAQDFQWFPVGKAVGNVKNQGHELIEPVSEQNRQGDPEL